MDTGFVAAMQRRAATVAVSASAVRGIGPTGTAVAAREHLAKLNLAGFLQPTERRFRFVLDRETIALKDALPRGGRHWGLARKLLNMFLRDALYNQYLSKLYHLKSVEPWLEVPLDSHVGKALRSDSLDSRLPAWKTIKALTPELGATFQSAARAIARRRGVAGVHLDLYYWRGQG